jgi:DNA-binding HxlR family transcriptional regulator
MARTHKKVSDPPVGKALAEKPVAWTPETAAHGVEAALKMLEGRWKLLILFQLFGGQVRRFSELERAIPAVEICYFGPKPVIKQSTRKTRMLLSGRSGRWR